MKQKDMVHTANMMTLPAIFSYSVALYMALIVCPMQFMALDRYKIT